jgi:NAD(P)H-dependent flavin oxidoreductase YrpB (nitropropane dioxygenase family)
MKQQTAEGVNLSEKLGLSLPLFAFSDMPEVVAAVSLAGGIGILGALTSDQDELDRRLGWLDEVLGDRPYGVDIVITAGDHKAPYAASQKAAEASIPQGHWDFVENLLAAHHVPPLSEGEERYHVHAVGLAVEAETSAQIDIALSHRTRVIVNALGPVPKPIVERVHQHPILVGALVGSAHHVERQLATGVDFLIAQGTEAGGHCGEISTMVLVPEVVEAVSGRVPVLAAGGIASGAQVVAALALGASGVWTGSVWLVSSEAAPYIHPVIREKLLAARSSDSVRSRAMSGKPMRQLRTAWTEAWESKASPGCLPAPLQGVIHHSTMPRFVAPGAIYDSAIPQFLVPGAEPLCGYPVGQVVGRLSSVRPVAQIVEEIRQQIEASMARLNRIRYCSE